MTQKRKHAASSADKIWDSKRLRPSQLYGSDDEHRSPANPQSRVDPTYGQRSAFPGLDGLVDQDALFYGPASDGLEYLQMVRSEAKAVPNLLVAPLSPRVVTADQHPDHEQGYYADGAYTAVPNATRGPSGDEDEEDPQEAYYASLCSRFSKLSATLQCPPPILTKPAVAAAEQALPFNPSSSAQWRRSILNTQPRMLLLNQLGQADVVSGLAVLETMLTPGNLVKRRSIGAWAWGLLAKCRDVGQMGSEEVGVLRDLGKKARGIFRGIMAGIEDDGEMEEGEDETNDGDRHESEDDHDAEAEREDPASNELATSDHEDSESLHSIEDTQILDYDGAKISIEISPPSSSESSDPLAAARQRLLDSLKPSSSDAHGSETIVDQGASHHGIEEKTQHDTADDDGDQRDTGDNDSRLRTRATLDMIITIVGEFYGQRDLLDGRLLWGEMPQGGVWT
ncbi:hypothetical protein MMC07_008590 [Pseudocyphellaria aurata]|nr:hypothetical protein [Pseudocyphellaria aurata]